MKKVLIANRGAIARRLIRTLNEIGLESVAVFSEADAGAPYLEEASSAIEMRGNRPLDTYLNVDAILKLSGRHGVDAIHPGYGFLSENSDFARSVEEKGITFIGPTSSSIETMGEKVRGRAEMQKYGFPVFAGSEHLSDELDLDEIAATVGFPLVVKPSGGGGGIGMQVVQHRQGLGAAVRQARAIAENAFSESGLYFERWVENPRHIEFQIVGDGRGGCIHLFDRECSIQRRHQKLIEESPAPNMKEEELARQAELAAEVCGQMKYKSLGTIETLFQSDGSFGFLEMNTRIQVEHGVTEQVTGMDLVRLQIDLAMGEELPLQSSITRSGFAMEARLYAEDPETMFPSTGRLQTFRLPDMFGVRVETGYQQGQDVSSYYDPLLAKIIASGNTREQALGRLLIALRAVDVRGVKTNSSLLQKVLMSDEFLSGNIDTGLFNRL